MVGAVAIVLAAMYVLRMISAVLHARKGPAVHDEALDLRPGELAIVVPLSRCCCSCRPGRRRSRIGCLRWLSLIASSIPRPPVDWFAISPSLALLAAAGVCLLVAVLVPKAGRRATAAAIAPAASSPPSSSPCSSTTARRPARA